MRIGDREYVDGGAWSVTNLDAAHAGRDTHVLCLDPTASLGGRDRRMAALRGAFRVASELELQALRRRGAQVVHVAPDDGAATAIGPNLMAPGRTAGALRAGYAQGRRLAAAYQGGSAARAQDRQRRRGAVGAADDADGDGAVVGRLDPEPRPAVAGRDRAADACAGRLSRATTRTAFSGLPRRATRTVRTVRRPARTRLLAERTLHARAGAPAMALGATPSAGGLGAANEVPGAIGASGGRLAGASARLSASVATGTVSGDGSTVGGTPA